MNAEIICVGTEILLGNITNTNSRDISEALAGIGVNVYWHTVVGDNSVRLTECLYRAKNRADLIITTGGLGPTCDDMTKQVLANTFDRKLYFDEQAAETLRQCFRDRGITDFTENNMRQAWLPEGCTILPNSVGTAPGCTFTQNDIRVFMLPGPPHECNAMLHNSVIPMLCELSGKTIRSHTIRFFGIGESSMETRLRDMMDASNPTVAPYSKEGECSARVTAKGDTEEECEEMMKPVVDEICKRLGDFVYGIDSDSLEQRVVHLLAEKNVSLAVAESCTGGLLAKRITDIPGASANFSGGAVTYTEDAKTRILDIDPEFISENGVVSMAVAGKMAKRIRKLLKSDLGIGITGWAGPDGDQVGQVFVGLACKGACYVRRLNIGAKSSRSRIRTIAVNNALDMIRRYLCGLEI